MLRGGHPGADHSVSVASAAAARPRRASGPPPRYHAGLVERPPRSPALSAVVETRALTKDYGGGVGLLGLDLSVEAGEVLGFLGPNGAGKTTTIRLLLDLIRPTSGEARLFGQPVGDPSVRRRVGYLPGELALDERLDGRRMLAFLDALRPPGAAPADPRRRDELCERLLLTDRDLDRQIRDDSRGTKQKIGLVAAFQHDPDLLVLDEPTEGLDPLVRDAALELMREAGAAGRTVFHSSHVLDEVDRTCTRVAIVRAGRLVAVEQMDALRASLARRMIVRLAEAPPADLDPGLPGVRVLEVSERTVVFEVSGELSPLLGWLAERHVEHLAFPEPDLEDAFRHHYDGAAP